MLNVIFLSAIMLSGVVLSVIMLSVTAPRQDVALTGLTQNSHLHNKRQGPILQNVLQL